MVPIVSTLAEIEAATEQLSEPQKEELLVFLTAPLGRKPSTADASAEGDSYPRLTTDPVTGWPLIICNSSNVINPTREQLSDF